VRNDDRASDRIPAAFHVEPASKPFSCPLTNLVHEPVLVIFELAVFRPPESPDSGVYLDLALTDRASG
jgi:hypothetical protein